MLQFIRILFQLVLLGLVHVSFAQKKEVPEPKVADMNQGVLPNGMHYYIMHNEEPKGRAAFYFAQNVGSILEEDSQRGLAHFLEHMAFNGTQHFPDKAMLKYLEKHGVRFDREINAFTKYDETVYSIRNVPVEDPELIDSVLLILHDWSGYLTLAEDEIDNERGVVHEEWRSRYNAQKRAQDSVLELGLLSGSKYAQRSPIGLMPIIDNFEYETLRNYYRKWYRPDQQAVIVVGDFDQETVASKVKKMFGDIPLRTDLPKRPIFKVPFSEDFTYVPIKDDELRIPTIQYFIKHLPDTTLTQLERIEKDLKLTMVRSILDARLIASAGKPGSPVFSARFFKEDVVRPLEVLKIELQPKSDSLLSAIKWAAIELKRFDLHGATKKEFDRVKSSMIQRFKSGIEKPGNSNVFNAIAIYETLFKGDKYLDYKWEQEYQLNYLISLSEEDLIPIFKEYYSMQGNVVAILGTEKLPYPEAGQVLNTLKLVNDAQPKPYEEVEVKAKKLESLELPGSEIVKKKQLVDDGGTKYTLANGAEVYLYAPKSPLDIVYFKAVSQGGRSVLPQDLLSNSLYATHFSAESGVANLNKKELGKSDEVVMPTVKIEEYQEILDGYANVNNLEKLNKGIYLAFTQPRFDADVFDTTLQNLKRLLTMLQSNIQSSLSDSLQMIKTNYNKREVHLSEQLLRELDMQKIEAVYRDRITNAADFKFVFMGDVEEDAFQEIIQKYIGSIPGTHSSEKYIDRGLRPAPGINKLHMIRDMQTPQATVNVYVTRSLAYTYKNKIAMEVIEQLLGKSYLEKIREEEGGTYGVRVNGGLKHLPDDHFELNISFNGNPDKIDKLVSIVHQELKRLSHEIDPVAFEEIKSNLKKAATENQDNNRFYFEEIIESVETGLPVHTVNERLKSIERLTTSDIMEVAKKINKTRRVVEAVLSPPTSVTE
ncbi:M16 family metallopeptidase [Fulvivirga ligni]|uniref:M16 family metallopeptidase n=1 Tax=Fulvivirga ligni TaxID=2904246 RepID=UPI001F37737D|nr:insulinase family protein [Fulvivirga ligni]UII19012.1 insulinase family protein [Fulvivirga ligni]